MGQLIPESTYFIRHVDVENKFWVLECPYCLEDFGDPMTFTMDLTITNHRYIWSKYYAWIDCHEGCHEKRLDEYLGELIQKLNLPYKDKEKEIKEFIDNVTSILKPIRVDIRDA